MQGLGIFAATLLFSLPAAAQNVSQNVANGMDDLRRCMTRTIDGAMAKSRSSPADGLVEMAFQQCRTEENLIAETLRDEMSPQVNVGRLMASMKVEMKKDYVSQIIKLRSKQKL